jgi:hypothetical protein
MLGRFLSCVAYTVAERSKRVLSLIGNRSSSVDSFNTAPHAVHTRSPLVRYSLATDVDLHAGHGLLDCISTVENHVIKRWMRRRSNNIANKKELDERKKDFIVLKVEKIKIKLKLQFTI